MPPQRLPARSGIRQPARAPARPLHSAAGFLIAAVFLSAPIETPRAGDPAAPPPAPPSAPAEPGVVPATPSAAAEPTAEEKLPPTLQRDLEDAVRAKISPLVEERNAEGVPFKRASYSRTFRPVP